jgi:methylmalonyl-CoA/ethylmalonyl-CoA epimerase
MLKIHHLGYAVQDLEASVDEFKRLGYDQRGDTTRDWERKVAIQFMTNGPYLIELIAPLSSDSPVNNILSKVGNSPYHICYEVDNIDAEISRLSGETYILIENTSEALAIGKRKVAFLYHADVGLIELINS